VPLSLLTLAKWSIIYSTWYNIEQMISRLENAGYSIAKAGAVDPFRKNVYFLDPDGFEVEFVQYLSDIPSERNLSS